MCDDSEPLDAENQPVSHRSPLRAIARALGVPVSSFFAPGLDHAVPMQDSAPDAAALLGLVQDHLMRASPEARRDFVARVQAMAESRSR